MNTGANLILTGMKHTGKSTVGQLLATALGRPFLDVDTVIGSLSGKTPRELYDEGGPALMMEWETRACQSVVELYPDGSGIAAREAVNPAGSGIDGAPRGRCVLATGGGLADNRDACAILRSSGILVFLDTDFETVFERVMTSAHRDGRLPRFLEGGDPRSLFLELFNRRREIYVTMSQMQILTGTMLPREIVQTIVNKLKE